MFRLKAFIAAVACVFSATTASAAVATYSGETYAWFQLDSAYLAGTQTDASEIVELVDYYADYYGWNEGLATLDGDADPFPWTYTRWWVTGMANNKHPLAGSYWDEEFSLLYRNESDSAFLDLTFSYAVEASSSASLMGKGSAWADASAGVFFNSGIFDWSGDSYSAEASSTANSRRSSTQTLSGTVSFTIAPGEELAAHAYYMVQGEATVAPVPVAGALPLLGTALVGLALLRRRRAGRA